MARTERHTALDWAEQIEAERRAAAHPRIPGATRLHLAIAQHMAHPAAALADCGTESLCDQVLTAPGQLFDNVGTEAGPPETPAMHQAHHLPGALQQPRTPPPPISFPEPAPNTRQRYAQMPRLERALDAAREAGHADGVRHGYRLGWRWGVCCGLVVGALLVTLAWTLYPKATAPAAATPSAHALPLPRG